MKTFKVKELGESKLKDTTSRTIVSKDSVTDINSVIKDLKFYFVEKWKIVISTLIKMAQRQSFAKNV